MSEFQNKNKKSRNHWTLKRNYSCIEYFNEILPEFFGEDGPTRPEQRMNEETRIEGIRVLILAFPFDDFEEIDQECLRDLGDAVVRVVNIREEIIAHLA